jgi:hypothetical protein
MAVVVVATGCATTEFLTVPDSDWRKLSQSDRDQIDRDSNARDTQARAELSSATAAEATARKLVAAPPPHHKAIVDDEGRVKTDALARIDTATAQQRKADLAWRVQRVEVAKARLDVVASERELARARTIDRRMTGDDSYDVGLYRGQLAHAQEKWYAAQARAAGTRAEVERAGAEVASAKEAFAQLVRSDGERLANNERDMKLSGWSTMPIESMHRRGFKLVSTTAPLALHGNGLGHRGPIVPHLR